MGINMGTSGNVLKIPFFALDFKLFIGQPSNIFTKNALELSSSTINWFAIQNTVLKVEIFIKKWSGG